MVKPRVSELTSKRLSLYLRYLLELEELGVDTVSSRTLAERFQLNPSQIRKDLACFGDFGTPGVGYEVRGLRRVIQGILGLDRSSQVVIVGAGNLGNALADYPGFNGGGFEMVALFDIDGRKVGGNSKRGVPIHPMASLETIISEYDVQIGIIAVPAEAAQEVADQLTACGVRGILNFAPTRPTVPASSRCNHVDLKVELENLSFFLSEEEVGDRPLADAWIQPVSVDSEA